MSKLLPGIGKNADLKPSTLKMNAFECQHPEIKDKKALEVAFGSQNVVRNPDDPTKTSFDSSKTYLIDDSVTNDIEGELDRRAQSYIGALGQLIDGIMQIPAPKAVAMVAASVANQARASGITDDALVAKAIGSFIMLRFISPKLASSAQKTPEAKEAAKVMSKIIQNSANGITKTVKELICSRSKRCSIPEPTR